MIDGCGREIDHLRLSLTDHCNLACRYCAPSGVAPTAFAPRGIDPEFAFELVRLLAQRHGIRFVRLTGGEPLLYSGLIPLIERLSELESLHEITLTTNAQALAAKARPLRMAGLSRINVSLDTLKADRFSELTRGGKLAHTLAGIEAAVSTGITPVKVNVVAQRGLNDDELPDLAEWGMRRGCVVRFLEVMPLGPSAHVFERHLVPAAEILQRIGERFELRAIPQSLGQPATDYAAVGRGLRGTIGVIAPTTRPFCSRCRRIRITSRGEVVACLHDDRRFDLTGFWNGKTLDVTGTEEVFQRAVQAKPEEGPRGQSLTMLSLGG